MKIAIVGATGLVGRKMLEIILQKNLTEAKNITLFASENSEGKIVEMLNNKFVVHKLQGAKIGQYNFALFCAGGMVSKKYAPKFAQKGAYVIDNSSAFRRKKNVPLVVPEINFAQIKEKNKLIANPNCSTIGASLVLFAISKKYEISRVIVSTYQACSGAGQKGICDLQNSTTKKFPYPIASNLIPQIDYPLKNQYTFEEDKMNYELKKILCNKKLKISATCVRVPVENCHSEAITIEFFKRPNINKIKKLLQEMPSIVLYDDLKTLKYPMPQLANGKAEVFVGRIRRDVSNPNAIVLFISFDNILKGASLNAVQILEKLIQNQK